MKKTLLLDIDYTLFDEESPRPFVKEFLEEMDKKYDIHFYTAGTRKRVAEVLRILKFTLGLDQSIITKLDRGALTRENCPMIELESGASVKSLDKAAEILGKPVEDMILFDDNPSYDNPRVDQVVQAEGWMKDMEDDNYLTRTGL